MIRAAANAGPVRSRTSELHPVQPGPVRFGLVQLSPDVLVAGLLLVGFTAAVLVRVAVGGADVARSASAGLVFAVLLLVLAWAGRQPGGRSHLPAPGLGRRASAAVLAGLAGGAVLCVPAVVDRILQGTATGVRPGFAGWALVVLVVATAEEVFLRGVLYQRLAACGIVTAVVVPAVAFAGLHLPLYGWSAMPLDLAVGVWLGAIRAVTGTWTAPAVAHVGADWAAWWLL